MTASLADFEAAVAQATTQATSFNAATLEKNQGILFGWFQTVSPAALTRDEWRRVAERLTQYRDLCIFLQRTLNQALCKAGRIEGAGYASAGRTVEQATPLMRRYG